ncbi:MAG: glycoside hydrolase family 88 protein [Clostridia bacterium]|nr:glycoside hydrolase family 88 protein [Clostridia bacterium]
MTIDTSSHPYLAIARRACDTMMRKFDAPDLPPKNHFHYHQGVFLSGLYKTYELCHDESYWNYMKAWVDSLIDANGNVSAFNAGHLDDLQPGVLLFPLYKRTGDVRYRYFLRTAAHYIRTCPKTEEGGNWHKSCYHDQMWLDGLYMAGPFSVEYGVTFDDPALVDDAIFQAQMMQKKTKDPVTGLWYHAWDATKAQPWANPETGCSPEFWGRSMGWVPVALLEEYELLPEDHPGRKTLAALSVQLLTALLPFQDPKTGMWYQVVNHPEREDNWLESSCTSLYICALCKAIRLGLMSRDLIPVIEKALKGLLETVGEDENGLLIGNVCIGTGVGDYAHYIARPTSTNDLHGVGAFLLMCVEADKLLS